MLTWTDQWFTMYSWYTDLSRGSKDTLLIETHLNFMLYLVNIVPFTNIISFLTTDLFDSVVAVTKLLLNIFDCNQPLEIHLTQQPNMCLHIHLCMHTLLMQKFNNMYSYYMWYTHIFSFHSILVSKNPGGKPTDWFHRPLMCYHLEFEKHSFMPHK